MARGLRSRRAQEGKIEVARRGKTKRLCQDKSLCCLTCQKNRHAVDAQRARQPIDQRGEHRVEISLRTKFASELKHGAAVVVTGAIEKLVEAVLYPFTYRVEQERRNHHSE